MTSNTRTIDELMRHCRKIMRNMRLSDQERRQKLNIFRRSVFERYGLYSAEFWQVDDFIKSELEDRQNAIYNATAAS